MERTLHLLLIAPDETLAEEIQAALGGIRQARVVFRHVGDYLRGAEAARGGRPDLVLIEMQSDSAEVRAFAEGVQANAPGATLVGIYTDAALGGAASESAFLIEAMRSKIRDFLRRPISSTELAGVIERHAPGEARAAAAGGRIVSFVSNKGGVGKSTVSVNTAVALALRHPDRVLLVDASLQQGVCASALDLEATSTVVDAVQELGRLDGALLKQLALRHDSGLRVLAAPANAIDAAQVDPQSLSRILTVARATFDYVIVDTFPLVDSVLVSILDLSDAAYVVTANAVPTVLGVMEFLRVLGRLGFPDERLHVVVNRTHPRFAGQLKPDEIAARIDRPVDHAFPFSKANLVGLDVGQPIALSARSFTGWGRALKKIATEIESGRSDAVIAPAGLARDAVEVAARSASSASTSASTPAPTSTRPSESAESAS